MVDTDAEAGGFGRNTCVGGQRIVASVPISCCAFAQAVVDAVLHPFGFKVINSSSQVHFAVRRGDENCCGTQWHAKRKHSGFGGVVSLIDISVEGGIRKRDD